ncbi:MAG: sigma-70 family RNA polymerase sigma factor [Candidatus Uhrbacteria bacterium]
MSNQKREFSKFYKANIDRIYRFVFFRVKDQETAEDLTSEIFMKALKAFDRYDVKQSKSAWLYAISRNHLINYYRDKKETIDIDQFQFELLGEDGRETIERNVGIQILKSALNKLSSHEQQIVTMKHLQGYTYTEMAEILGKSHNALKVATHRALNKLKVLIVR